MTACTRTGTGLNDEHQTYAILKVYTSDKSPKTFSVTFGFLIPIFVTSNHFVCFGLLIQFYQYNGSINNIHISGRLRYLKLGPGLTHNCL